MLRNIFISLSSTILILFASCSKPSVTSERILKHTSQKVPDSDTSFKPFAEGRTTMHEFIGVDGFHEEDVEFIKPAGFLRAYVNTDWFTGDYLDGQLQFMPSRSGWFFDEAFQKIRDAGIGINMCIHHAPGNARSTPDGDEDKPLNSLSSSTTDPNSYSKFAEVLFQLTARYGSAKHDEARLHSNDKKSGLNLFKYLEVWNEPDKTWRGPAANFTPQEYAAMLSICYDKIKLADPSMKVVMGGLAGPSLDFIQQMDAWFKTHRSDKKFAADVINFHDYAFNSSIVWGVTWPLPSPGEIPEKSTLFKNAQNWVKWRNENLPNAEVWISEFGWDTRHDSPLAPPTKSREKNTLEEAQGIYLIRSFVTFASLGIDKAQQFTLVDPSQYDYAWQFGTSGLIDRTNWGRKKPSWYYVYTLRNILRNMVFIGEEKTQDQDVKIYKFRDVSSNKGAYVIWSIGDPEMPAKTINLNVNRSASSMVKVELKDKETAGKLSNLKKENNSVVIDISEKPIFVTVDFIR